MQGTAGRAEVTTCRSSTSTSGLIRNYIADGDQSPTLLNVGSDSSIDCCVACFKVEMVGSMCSGE